MSQKFGFVCGNVDIRGTFRLAGFAGKTKIERFLHVLIVPAVSSDFTLQHFKQHVRAAASGMLFFERGHVAWTHGAGILFAARTQSKTAQRSFRERPVIVWIGKVRVRLCRVIVRAEPQIFCWQVRLDHFVRIHAVFRIPRGLEFAECADQFGPNIFGSSAPRDCPSPCSPESEPP